MQVFLQPLLCSLNSAFVGCLCNSALATILVWLSMYWNSTLYSVKISHQHTSCPAVAFCVLVCLTNFEFIWAIIPVCLNLSHFLGDVDLSKAWDNSTIKVSQLEVMSHLPLASWYKSRGDTDNVTLCVHENINWFSTEDAFNYNSSCSCNVL